MPNPADNILAESGPKIPEPGVVPTKPSLGKSLWNIATTGNVPLDTSLGNALSFLLVASQCLAIYWVIRRFRVENELFRLIILVAFAGFIIHHLLPLRHRLRFFLTLSAGLVLYSLGLDRGEWIPGDGLVRGGSLFAIGVAIIAICRLPIRFNYRVLLLLGAGAGLAFYRAGFARLEPLDAIWPILGAMFMYRTACYLYDVEHERTKSTWLHALSYFFLFPALWLFVFPLIDFKTFVREYYNGKATLIYQRGVQWMIRGLIQLLLWRVIYYQVYIDPARITNGAELAQFVLANIGLYLRVTGQFHFAIGLLHLFGFALPETNRKYFLASDFVDYWRRANIYMKDFLMKICYYPLVLHFKRLGERGSVMAAILCTFALTWFLHPYQTFWIAGSFPIEVKDILFWSLLCLGVMYGSLRGLRTPSAARHTHRWRQSIRLALSTGLTFVLVTCLWSIWSTDDLELWLSIWKQADSSTAAVGLGAFVLVSAGRLLFDSPVSPWPRQPAKVNPLKGTSQPVFWAVKSCFLPAALLIAASSDQVFDRLSEPQKVIAQSFFSNTPNKSGEEFLTRGYYENIMDTARVSPLLDGALSQKPSSWKLLESTPAVRETPDLRTRELVQSQELVINRVPFASNSRGLRDKEYSQRKPVNTARVALMGSSITMGWNVPKEETFEAILERRLNQDFKGFATEILNFAVNGYSIVSLVEQLDQQVLQYEPSAVAVVSHPEDPGRAVYMLAKSLSMGYRPRYEFLRKLVAEAGVQPNDPRNWIERKLSPFGRQLTEWSYRQIASTCRENGIEPWLIYLPGVLQTSIGEMDHTLATMAREAGFETVLLYDVYSGVQDRSTLMVAPWDAHPNAAGHRLVADSLHHSLRDLVGSLRVNPAPSEVTK